MLTKAPVFIKRATIRFPSRRTEAHTLLLHLLFKLYVLRHQVVDSLLLMGDTHLPNKIELLFLVFNRVAHFLQLSDRVHADHWLLALLHLQRPAERLVVLGDGLKVGEEGIGHARDVRDLVGFSLALCLSAELSCGTLRTNLLFRMGFTTHLGKFLCRRD
jgi:hypothetical protein